METQRQYFNPPNSNILQTHPILSYHKQSHPSNSMDHPPQAEWEMGTLGNEKHNDDGGRNYHFFHKVYKLPILNSSIDKAMDVYENTKNRFEVVEIIDSKVKEQVALRVTPTIDKVNQQLRPRLQSIDNYACASLDILKEKVPIINETPVEILEHVKSHLPPEIHELITERLPKTIELTVSGVLHAASSLQDKQLILHLDSAACELQHLLNNIHRIPSALQTLPVTLGNFIHRAQEAIVSSPILVTLSQKNDVYIRKLISTIQGGLQTLTYITQALSQVKSNIQEKYRMEIKEIASRDTYKEDEFQYGDLLEQQETEKPILKNQNHHHHHHHQQNHHQEKEKKNEHKQFSTHQPGSIPVYLIEEPFETDLSVVIEERFTEKVVSRGEKNGKDEIPTPPPPPHSSENQSEAQSETQSINQPETQPNNINYGDLLIKELEDKIEEREENNNHEKVLQEIEHLEERKVIEAKENERVHYTQLDLKTFVQNPLIKEIEEKIENVNKQTENENSSAQTHTKSKKKKSKSKKKSH